MRITRRTSGGRGEYEISEPTPQGIGPSDMVDRRLVLALDRKLKIDTATELRHAQGKFRIRMLEQAQMHLHRQLIAALMLPSCVRADETQGSGSPVVQKGRYAVEHIMIRRASVSKFRAVLYVSGIIVRNRSQPAEEIGLPERMENLRRVWRDRLRLPGSISEMMQDHEALVQGGGPMPELAEKLVDDIQNAAKGMLN